MSYIPQVGFNGAVEINTNFPGQTSKYHELEKTDFESIQKEIQAARVAFDSSRQSSADIKIEIKSIAFRLKNIDVKNLNKEDERQFCALVTQIKRLNTSLDKPKKTERSSSSLESKIIQANLYKNKSEGNTGIGQCLNVFEVLCRKPEVFISSSDIDSAIQRANRKAVTTLTQVQKEPCFQKIAELQEFKVSQGIPVNFLEKVMEGKFALIRMDNVNYLITIRNDKIYFYDQKKSSLFVYTDKQAARQVLQSTFPGLCRIAFGTESVFEDSITLDPIRRDRLVFVGKGFMDVLNAWNYLFYQPIKKHFHPVTKTRFTREDYVELFKATARYFGVSFKDFVSMVPERAKPTQQDVDKAEHEYLFLANLQNVLKLEIEEAQKGKSAAEKEKNAAEAAAKAGTIFDFFRKNTLSTATTKYRQAVQKFEEAKDKQRSNQLFLERALQVHHSVGSLQKDQDNPEDDLYWRLDEAIGFDKLRLSPNRMTIFTNLLKKGHKIQLDFLKKKVLPAELQRFDQSFALERYNIGRAIRLIREESFDKVKEICSAFDLTKEQYQSFRLKEDSQ